MEDSWCYEDLPEGEHEGHTGEQVTGHPDLVTCQACIDRFQLKKGHSPCSPHVLLSSACEYGTKCCANRFHPELNEPADPDFRQRMHFMGPQGYYPCTIEWPHEGPCAHHKRPSAKRAKQFLGTEITTVWYDGPLRSMRLVKFSDGERLVQVDTCLATVGEPFTIGYDNNVRDVMVRFTREELMDMLRILDGQPVKDWRDEEIISRPEEGDRGEKIG